MSFKAPIIETKFCEIGTQAVAIADAYLDLEIDKDEASKRLAALSFNDPETESFFDIKVSHSCFFLYALFQWDEPPLVSEVLDARNNVAKVVNIEKRE